MGYYIRAFIGRTGILEPIAGACRKARIVTLEQGLTIVPMIDELYDEINKTEPWPGIEPFTYLTTYTEQRVLQWMPSGLFGYIEAEYHGGQGAQAAILWQDGKRLQVFNPKHAINTALQHAGFTADAGKDEFDAVGLGRHRYTEDW